MRKAMAALSVAILLAACGDAADEPKVEAAEQQLGEPSVLSASADLSIPPEAWLFFNPGWNEGGGGTLYEGGKVNVVAAPERFQKCGIEGTVSFFAKTDSGETVEVALTDLSSGWPSGVAQIPAGTRSIETWLKAVAGDCEEYDSDLGANYRFPVHAWAPVVVHFNGDWSEKADGELKAGGALVVDYDPARLPDCRATYRDVPMWDIVAHVRFDTGELLSRSVLDWYTDHGVRRDAERGLTVFPIPQAAHSVELWFENSQNVPYPTSQQCPAWDSDFGKNYRFEILRRGAPPPDSRAPGHAAGSPFRVLELRRPGGGREEARAVAAMASDSSGIRRANAR